jgi:hypothetical protein
MTSPKNMKAVTRGYTNIDQTDTTMDFDGMVNKNLPASKNRLAGNRSGLTGLTNAGRGPTVGNKDHAAMKIGPAATFDPYTCPPCGTSVPALPKQGSVRDDINRGAQVRTPGGTRPFAPSATQNYKGNPDRINAGNNGGRKPETFLK